MSVNTHRFQFVKLVLINRSSKLERFRRKNQNLSLASLPCSQVKDTSGGAGPCCTCMVNSMVKVKLSVVLALQNLSLLAGTQTSAKHQT